MKCERCEFAPGLEEDCPMWDQYGTVWKDGLDGCTVSYHHLKKMEREHDRDLGIMGLEMGIEYDFEHKGLSVEKAIDHMSHMIGMDNPRHKPYRRHGKVFYKPWRNYWCGYDAELDYLSQPCIELVERVDWGGQGIYYYVNRSGLDWLGRRLNMTIHTREGEK